MAYRTLHLVAVLTEATLPELRAAWSPRDSVFALSHQAKAVLAAAEIPCQFLGERLQPSWEALHEAVRNQLNWSGIDAADRWDWEPFLLHETTRDFLLCATVFDEIQREATHVVRWWNQTEDQFFAGVEILLSKLTIPVFSGSSSERANLFS